MVCSRSSIGMMMRLARSEYAPHTPKPNPTAKAIGTEIRTIARLFMLSAQKPIPAIYSKDTATKAASRQPEAAYPRTTNSKATTDHGTMRNTFCAAQIGHSKIEPTTLNMGPNTPTKACMPAFIASVGGGDPGVRVGDQIGQRGPKAHATQRSMPPMWPRQGVVCGGSLGGLRCGL